MEANPEPFKALELAVEFIAAVKCEFPDEHGDVFRKLNESISIISNPDYHKIGTKDAQQRATIENSGINASTRDEIITMSDRTTCSENICRAYIEEYHKNNRPIVKNVCRDCSNMDVFSYSYEQDCLSTFSIVIAMCQYVNDTRKPNDNIVQYLQNLVVEKKYIANLIRSMNMITDEPSDIMSKLQYSKAQCLFFLTNVSNVSSDEVCAMFKLCYRLGKLVKIKENEEFLEPNDLRNRQQNLSQLFSSYILVIMSLLSVIKKSQKPIMGCGPLNWNNCEEKLTNIPENENIFGLNYLILGKCGKNTYTNNAINYGVLSFLRVVVVPAIRKFQLYQKCTEISLPGKLTTMERLIAWNIFQVALKACDLCSTDPVVLNSTKEGKVGIMLFIYDVFQCVPSESITSAIRDSDPFVTDLITMVEFDDNKGVACIPESYQILGLIFRNNYSERLSKITKMVCSTLDDYSRQLVNRNQMTPITGEEIPLQKLLNNPDALAVLSSQLDYLRNILDCDRVINDSRSKIYDTYDLVSILLPMVAWSLPAELKGKIFGILAVIAKRNESSVKVIWNRLEECKLMVHVFRDREGTGEIRTRQTIRDELENVESKCGRYPITDGFLCLLEALIARNNYRDIGLNHRVPGVQVYIDYIVDEVLMKLNDRKYSPDECLGHGQKWKLAARCVRILVHILKQYNIEMLQRDGMMFNSEDDDRTINELKYDFEEEILQEFTVSRERKTRAPRPRSLGFQLLASLLGGSGLVDHLFSLMTLCNRENMNETSFQLFMDDVKFWSDSISTLQGTDEEDDIFGYGYKSTSCDPAYWKERLEVNILELFYLCSLKEEIFLEQVQSKDSITVTFMQNGRALRQQLIARPLSRALIPKGKIDLLFNLSTWKRLHYNNYRPIPFVMALSIIAKVTRDCDDDVMNSFQGSARFILNRFITIIHECMVDTNFIEDTNYLYPIGSESHESEDLTDDNDDKAQCSNDDLGKQAVASLILSTLCKNHIGLSHHILGLQNAAMSRDVRTGACLEAVLNYVSSTDKAGISGTSDIMQEFSFELLYRLVESPLTANAVTSILSRQDKFFDTVFTKFNDILQSADMVPTSEQYSLSRRCLGWFLDMCALILFRVSTPGDNTSADIVPLILGPLLGSSEQSFSAIFLSTMSNEFCEVYSDTQTMQLVEQCQGSQHMLQIGQINQEWLQSANRDRVYSGFYEIDEIALSMIENKDDVDALRHFNSAQRINHATYQVCSSWYRLMSIVFTRRQALRNYIASNTENMNIISHMRIPSMVNDMVVPSCDLANRMSSTSNSTKIQEPIAKALLVMVHCVAQNVTTSNELSVDQFSILLNGVVTAIVSTLKSSFICPPEFFACLSQLLQIPFEENMSYTSTVNQSLSALLLRSNVVVLRRDAMSLLDTLCYNSIHGNAATRLTSLSALNDVVLTFARGSKSDSSDTMFSQYLHRLRNSGFIIALVKTLTCPSSWSQRQAIWSSMEDFRNFVQNDFIGHDQLFAATITFCNHIACSEDGSQILRECGLLSTLHSLPYFFTQPPTSNELSMFAKEGNVQRELDQMIERYYLPVSQLLCTLLTSGATFKVNSVVMAEECLRFLMKNVQTVEHFAKMRYPCLLGLEIINHSLCATKLILSQLTAKGGSYDRYNRQKVLSSMENVDANSAVSKPVIDPMQNMFFQFEGLFVVESFSILKIFGFHLIPSKYLRAVDIQKWRPSLSQTIFDSEESQPTWWSSIRPKRDNDRSLECKQVVPDQLTAFDVAKIHNCMQIVRNAAAFLRILLETSDISETNMFSDNNHIESSEYVHRAAAQLFSSSDRYIDVSALVRSFIAAAEIALTRNASTDREALAVSSMESTATNAYNRITLRAMIIANSVKICNDLLVALQGYICSLSSSDLRRYRGEMESLKKYAEAFAGDSSTGKIYRKLRDLYEMRLLQ